MYSQINTFRNDGSGFIQITILEYSKCTIYLISEP